MSGDSSETPKERIGRIRRLAAKARESAAKSSSPVEREEFLQIADQWEVMADSIMSDAGRDRE